MVQTEGFTPQLGQFSVTYNTSGCARRELIQSIQQGLLSEGIMVSIAKLCACFGIPRRTVYYKPTKAAAKVDPRFADPIKAMIETEPSFGYRTVAWLLGFNKEQEKRAYSSVPRLWLYYWSTWGPICL